jgi:hypothetical protein
MTECPKCHVRDCLIVFEVKHPASGRTYHPGSKLEPDGFYFEPGSEWKDASTEDEKIRCAVCGETFDLFDLFDLSLTE